MMRELAFAIVLSAFSSVACAETLRVGDAVLEFDPARFTVQSRGDDGVTIACIATECGRRGDRRPIVHVGSFAAAVGPMACWPLDIRESRRERRETVSVGSLTFEVMSAESGCRALAPGFLGACAPLGSSMLRMSTGSLGCSTAPIFPRPMLLELIRGVKPAS